MSIETISNEYLRRFFSISSDPEGDAEIAEIRRKLQRQQFSHGQDIVRVDEEADGIYFLVSGAAVVLDRDGEQINVMNEGQYFGEYGVLSGQRRLSTVRAQGKAVVYKLSSPDMMEILRRHPGIYGDLMKQVYAQVSQKHRQLLALSRMRRGVLRHPDSQTPLTPHKMLLRYGLLALVFLLSALLVPSSTTAPAFLLPLLLMLVYVEITHQTLEALIVAGLYAALLIWRKGCFPGFTDALVGTLGNADTAETIIIMTLLGSFVSLIEASGAVNAFRRFTTRRVRSPRALRFAILGILAVTSVDDWLNACCASGSTNSAAEEQRVSCEDRALLLSFLPTVLCSFVPISLWGVFVIGSIGPAAGGNGIAQFVRSIPFNFFSLVVLFAMLLHCFDRLPRTKRLRQAAERIRSGGALWPAGSERYLRSDDTELWGRISNLLIPVLVLAVASVTIRSVLSGHFIVDSACGLAATLIVMYFLYCGQRLMSPEQFFDTMITGMQSMLLPNLLYILTMCFASMLGEQALGSYFDNAVAVLQPVAALLPAALFLVSTLLTVALGSSWAMYVIAFPIALRMAGAVGLSAPLCIGAVCAAGIAGEKCCVFTSDHESIGELIGCDPSAVLALRIPYAIIFSLASLLCYAVAGLFFH